VRARVRQPAQTGERLTDRRFGCSERDPPPNPPSPALTFARHVAAFVRQSLADANHAGWGARSFTTHRRDPMKKGIEWRTLLRRYQERFGRGPFSTSVVGRDLLKQVIPMLADNIRTALVVGSKTAA
jgi:hypothetical protein